MAQLRDFYLRPESDPAHRPDQLEIYDELESTLQQIKMTLFTKRGEVLGEPNFGVDVEKYLFEFSIDPFALTRDAQNQINSYVTETRKRTIGVRPASYADERANREIFVLLIDIPEIKTPLSIFYD
jgi:hypothetical protein